MPQPITRRAIDALNDFLTKFPDKDKAKLEDVAKYLKEDTFDTNKNDIIDVEDTGSGLLREMLWGDLRQYPGLTSDQILKFAQARQMLLDALVKNASLREPPPDLSKQPYKVDQNVLDNPYKLPIENDRLIWQQERLRYRGQNLDIDPARALGLVKEAQNTKQAGETDIQAIVRGLWSNYDYTQKRVFRMEEIYGVKQWIDEQANGDESKKEALKKEFSKEMGTYINKTFGAEAQFTLDSLVALYQSTDWSSQDPITQELKGFVKDLGEGITNTENTIFTAPEKMPTKGDGKGVAVANYNGKEDGNIYGSMALVRYWDKDDDGKDIMKFDWLQYETGSIVNKTRYNFTASKTGPRFDAGSGGKPKTTGPATPGELKQKIQTTVTTASKKVQEIIDKLPKPAADAPNDDPGKVLLNDLAFLKEMLDDLNTTIGLGMSAARIKGIIESLIKLLETAAKENSLQPNMKEDLNKIAEELKTYQEPLKAEIPTPPVGGVNLNLREGLGGIFQNIERLFQGLVVSGDNNFALLTDEEKATYTTIQTYKKVVNDYMAQPRNANFQQLRILNQSLIEKAKEGDDIRLLTQISEELNKLDPSGTKPKSTSEGGYKDSLELITNSSFALRKTILDFEKKTKDDPPEEKINELKRIDTKLTNIIAEVEDSKAVVRKLDSIVKELNYAADGLTDAQKNKNDLREIANKIRAEVNEIKEGLKAKPPDPKSKADSDPQAIKDNLAKALPEMIKEIEKLINNKPSDEAKEGLIEVKQLLNALQNQLGKRNLEFISKVITNTINQNLEPTAQKLEDESKNEDAEKLRGIGKQLNEVVLAKVLQGE